MCVCVRTKISLVLLHVREPKIYSLLLLLPSLSQFFLLKITYAYPVKVFGTSLRRSSFSLTLKRFFSAFYLSCYFQEMLGPIFFLSRCSSRSSVSFPFVLSSLLLSHSVCPSDLSCLCSYVGLFVGTTVGNKNRLH